MLADQGQASRRGLGGLPITTRSPRQDRAAGEWGRGSGRNSLLLASSFPHGPGSSVIRRGRGGGNCQALQGRGSQRPRPGVTTGLATRGAIERHGGPLEACGRRGHFFFSFCCERELIKCAERSRGEVKGPTCVFAPLVPGLPQARLYLLPLRSFNSPHTPRCCTRYGNRNPARSGCNRWGAFP